MKAQLGILADLPHACRYITFRLRPGGDPCDGLRTLAQQSWGDRLVVGIGASLVAATGGHIPGLKTFSAQVGPSGIVVPSTPEALWCWLRGHDRGSLLHAGRDLERLLGETFAIRSVVDGFKHEGGRDLSGYEDGTENPQGDKALQVALVPEGGVGGAGASFVAVQQWVHDFAALDRCSPSERDRIVGRRRSDNKELDDAPPSAHVVRTAQESFSPEAFLLRRSAPWADATRAGLMFVAFSHSFAAFETQLQHMLGHDDGIVDGLFRFTRPITGSYFWCPPCLDGYLDLTALDI